MISVLPKKLAKEPLFDAIFEIRFKVVPAASSIVPGFLFGKLEGTKSIEKLAIGDLPQQLRDQDPNLRFAPVVKLHWESFLVQVSDRSVSVACTLPYPGWTEFKKAILKILGLLGELKIIESVERFSMKYVDILPSKSIEEQVALVNIDVTLGTHKLLKENFQLRIEIQKDDLTHVVQIVSSAIVDLPGKGKIEGVIVDIDSIKDITPENFIDFLGSLEGERLEQIHISNKKMFFSCLNPETIQSLEPIYE